MSSVRLKEILQNTFSSGELSLLDDDILELGLDLEEILNLDDFISECQKESSNAKVAGEHRLPDWEKGWSGAGVHYSNDAYNNLPYYFKNNTHVRVGNRVYKDNNGFAEVDMLRALQLVVFRKLLPKFDSSTICEYGCGTGSNIQFLRNRINTTDFFGTDWAVSACNKLVDNKILSHDKVHRTDYFDPSTFFGPDAKYIAFTNASLEQSGDRYHDFVNYLIDNNKCLGGIHIEPMRELLDLQHKINQQSFEYAENRGYLTGFCEYMSSIPSIDILVSKDYGIGSKYINGYQVLCWKKI